MSRALAVTLSVLTSAVPGFAEPAPAKPPPGSTPAAELPYRPCQRDDLDLVYNLNFADRPELLRPADGRTTDDAVAVLLAQPPNVADLKKLAADEAANSRFRSVAYDRLRAAGVSVPKRRLLGAIVEIALDNKIDAVAAFSDGGLVYLNCSGTVIIENRTKEQFRDAHQTLMDVSAAAIKVVRPSKKPRLPPPGKDQVRYTFLVSDGLSFGEGSYDSMKGDPVGGRMLGAAFKAMQAFAGARGGGAAPTR